MYDNELSIRDYLQIFFRRWWVIAVCAVACAALAFAWTARQTPQYQSSAAVLINQANAADLFDPVGNGNIYSYAERLAATEARFLTSGIVSDEAIRRLGYQAYVDVVVDDFADVLTITATSPDPGEAQEIAQTYADAYVDVREQRFASERTATANQLAERLAEIDLQIANANTEDALRLNSLRNDVAESLDLLNLTAGLAEGSGALVIDNALRPGAPFTPRTNRNVTLGLLLGLMGGAGLILLLEALDRSVKTREMLESLTPGAPNLAVVPSLGKSLQRRETLVSQSDPTGQTAEAFRTLRAALQYVAVDDSARVIQIVSAHSAAGKTTVAANLAITLAQAGQRVVVIDADLRRPRLHQLFGVEQVPGLTSAIIGAAPLADCIHRMQDDGPTPFVLPSGPIPPGPAELLGSAAGARAIELIRDLADYVIIDTPPVLPVADTVVLSRYVDASILVVDASKTKRADVTLTYDRLAQAGAPVIGTVLNKVKRRFGLTGYGYGYGYGGYQQDGGEARPGLVGWFSRSGDSAKIERLHGSDIPRFKAAQPQNGATVSPAAKTSASSAVTQRRTAASTAVKERVAKTAVDASARADKKPRSTTAANALAEADSKESKKTANEPAETSDGKVSDKVKSRRSAARKARDQEDRSAKSAKASSPSTPLNVVPDADKNEAVPLDAEAADLLAPPFIDAVSDTAGKTLADPATDEQWADDIDIVEPESTT